jgi:hypothetical protein
MKKKKLSPEDEKVWQGELSRAEKYLLTAVKADPNRPLKHIDDGKQDIYVSFKYPELVQIVASYGIERLVAAIGKVGDAL